jgi:hypothetical protein|tara:strand:- start:38229 stop:38366 length:138 start_codon:yes stop_codon:yes gene_type:complete
MTQNQKAMVDRAQLLQGHLSDEQRQAKAENLRRKMDESSQRVRAA